MSTLWLMAGIILLITAVVWLRLSINKRRRVWGSALLFVFGLTAFVLAYGLIAGLFTGLAAIMVIGLLVAIVIGKPIQREH